MNKNKNKKPIQKQIEPWLFLAPFLTIYLCFFLGPAIYSFVLSFTKYKGYGEMKFVGVQNYTKLLNYSAFWTAVSNTMFYLVAHVILVVIISFLLALLIKSDAIRRKRLLKVGFFVPQITASVAAIMIWKVLLGTRSGVINRILGTSIPFLEDLHLMKWSVVLVMAWRSIGWYMVIYFAGLSTVPEDVIEAAKIDGANAVQQVWKVILPLMKPTFVFVLFNCCVTTFKVYNEPNLLIGSANSAAPASVAPIMNMVVNNIRNGNFGVASAAGWLIFLFIFVITTIQNRVLKDKEEMGR